MEKYDRLIYLVMSYIVPQLFFYKDDFGFK